MFKDRSEEIKNMSDEEYKKGLLKFNIPDCDRPYSLSGEGVWGWTTPEEKEKYADDSYEGKITAILCNNPFEYNGLLHYGIEVQLQCHGESRPTLDPEWITNCIRNMKEAIQC